MRFRDVMNEKRTYGARGNVILVDFQPVHSTSTRLTGPGGYDTSLSNAIEYLNNFNGKALIFYNGMDVGIEDTEEEVQEHYFERGLNTNADLNFMEKGYAFLRGWMDNNIEDWMIIRVFRYMYNNRLNDSRDIEEDQLKAIIAISNQLKFNELLKKFLGFLVSKRRFFYVKKILNDFISICSNARGEIQAELSVSKNLNENEINNIKSELSSIFGSNIKLNHKYDSSLIGGLVIKVGSTMIDTSIKNKLQQIEKKMIEA